MRSLCGFGGAACPGRRGARTSAGFCGRPGRAGASIDAFELFVETRVERCVALRRMAAPRRWHLPKSASDEHQPKRREEHGHGGDDPPGCHWSRSQVEFGHAVLKSVANVLLFDSIRDPSVDVLSPFGRARARTGVEGLAGAERTVRRPDDRLDLTAPLRVLDSHRRTAKYEHHPSDCPNSPHHA